MTYIMHVDGDAFFAACEVSRRPDLRGKPVVVGEDRGIACALTYEAKKLGVTRGMPIFQIRKEYPSVTVMTSHFELYEIYNRRLVSILRRHLRSVEPYSIDECFAELASMPEDELKAYVISLKMEIQQSLGITFSFGIAPTKTLAKLASKMGKPDGCYFLLDPREIEDCLRRTAVGSIWGIGRAVSAQLIGRNILSAYDFIKTGGLEKHFAAPVISTKFELEGKLVYTINGNPEDKKSIQATRSMSKRTSNRSMLFSELSRNIETACKHLRESGLLTNMAYFYYKTDRPFRKRIGGEFTLRSFTDDPRVILEEVEILMDRVFDPNLQYKSTGVTLTDLRRSQFVPEDLFNFQETSRDQSSYISIVDAINRKFGPWSLMQASSMRSVIARGLESEIRDKKDNYEYGLPLAYMGEAT